MHPRIRVTLNKGRKGVPLEKLAAIAEETAKFLTDLGEDLGTSGENGWVADNFANGSVVFDLEDPTIPEQESDRWRRGLRAVMANDFGDAEINLLITRTTRQQYAAIGRVIDADEVVEFGVYRNGTSAGIESYVLVRQPEEPADIGPINYTYFGEIQGVVHALFKEAKNPRLSIRELATRELVDCYFSTSLYADAVEVLRDPDAIVFVEGDVTESAESGRVVKIEVKHFKVAPRFDLAEFENMIGKFPGALTGGRPTSQVMDDFRD